MQASRLFLGTKSEFGVLNESGTSTSKQSEAGEVDEMPKRRIKMLIVRTTCSLHRMPVMLNVGRLVTASDPMSAVWSSSSLFLNSGRPSQ